jgi:hypothetical protein
MADKPTLTVTVNDASQTVITCSDSAEEFVVIEPKPTAGQETTTEEEI